MGDMLSPPVPLNSQVEGKGVTEEQTIVLLSVSQTATHRTLCLGCQVQYCVGYHTGCGTGKLRPKSRGFLAYTEVLAYCKTGLNLLF